MEKYNMDMGSAELFRKADLARKLKCSKRTIERRMILEDLYKTDKQDRHGRPVWDPSHLQRILAREMISK